MQPLSKRAIASRANGAKSHGPTSYDGKRRSSANSTRHGLLAKSVVLTYESEGVFQQFFDEHLQKLNPADGVEYAIVEEIVVAAWRLRRVWNVETTLFNKGIARSTENSAPGRAAEAFTSLGINNQLQLLDRYETRLQRLFQRGLKTLEQLRKQPQVTNYPEPNEPILKPTEYRDGMTVPPHLTNKDLPNEPNSATDLPAPTQESPNANEVEDVVEQAAVTKKAQNNNEPTATNQNQSQRPNDSVPFHVIQFPSKT
jgi:hypothetical protein